MKKKRKVLSAFMAMTMILAAVTACSSGAGTPSAGTGSTAAASTAPASTGTGEGGEISLFIWTEYMPQSVLDEFQNKYNIKVDITTFSSIADMYSKVKSAPAGTYDVIDSAEMYVERMGKEGLLETLDKNNLPNIKNLTQSYLKPWYDPDNTYSVPYLGGVATLCYNKSKIPNGVKSYEDLFDPSLKNSIVAIDDFRVVIGAVNKMLGFDYNETDPKKLEQTRKKLMELKPNIKLLDSDSPKTALISGEATVGLIYSAEIALAMEENPDIQIVYPSEGQYLFLDSLCVAKGSKNKALAEKFINFVMEPEISKMIAEAYPYTNPNAQAMKLMDDSYKNNPAKNVPESAVAKGLGVKDVGSAIDIYNDIWTEFTK